jgi:hypothetical protein
MYLRVMSSIYPKFTDCQILSESCLKEEYYADDEQRPSSFGEKTKQADLGGAFRDQVRFQRYRHHPIFLQSRPFSSSQLRPRLLSGR